MICVDPIANAKDYAQFSKNSGTTDAYSNQGYDQPQYGTSSGYSGSFSPSLVHMFVVTVVDGRLGEFNLSPVVVFPQSPKYITAQPNRPRSGVASSVGSSAWLSMEDEVRDVQFGDVHTHY